MRMSAAYVVESMENDIIAAVARHMFDLATAAAAAQTNQSSILRAQSLPHVPATLSSGQEHPTDEPRKARVSAVALTPSRFLTYETSVYCSLSFGIIIT